MSVIMFNCPACEVELESPSEMQGRHTQCPHCESMVIVPRIDFASGFEIGGFVLSKRLGVGGMGEVWLARQTSMDRDVALKILNPEFSADENFVSRFMKEVKISAKMDHRNMITAYDAGYDKGCHYLAVSFVEGEELGAKLERVETIPEQEALLIIRDIAEALRYAWNKFQMLHRDIKPANIMIEATGRAKLMDMGISKSRMDDKSLTMTGMIVGTPHYMSPEQSKGDKNIDCRADIYSLGATLYHMVTGRVPFDANTQMGVLAKHITEPLIPAREINPDVSEACSALIQTMMDKNTERRQQTWEDVLRDVDFVLSGKSPNNLTSSNKAVKRFPKIFLSGSLALLVFAVLLVVLAVINRDVDKLGESTESPSRDDSMTAIDIDSDFTASPTSGSSVPAPAIKTADAGKQREMWLYAVNFANEHRGSGDDLNTAIQHFKQIKERLKGTKYELMASTEAAKLETLKEKMIRDLISSLAEKSRSLIDKGDYKQAESVYRDYTGAFGGDTEKERKRLADEVAERAKEKEMERLRREREVQRRFENVLEQSSVSLVEGDSKKALDMIDVLGKSLQDGEWRSKLKTVRDMIRDYGSMDKFVSDTLKRKIGKKVTIRIEGKTETVLVKSVKRSRANVVVEKNKVKVNKPINISKLDLRDKLDLLDAMPAESQALSQGLTMLRENKPKEALKFFEKTGAFAPFMIAAVKRSMGHDKKERMESDTPSRTLERSPERGGRPVPPEIRRLFKGQVTSFEPSEREIVILYDFNDQEQLKDWNENGSDRADAWYKIANGRLVLNFQEAPSFLGHKAVFDEIEIRTQVSFSGNGFAQFVGNRFKNYIVMASGFHEKKDGVIEDFSRAGGTSKPFKESKLRENERYETHFSWKNGRVNFSVGRYQWPEKKFDVRNAHFSFAGSDSMVAYDRVEIKGKLNGFWFAQQR